MGASYSRVFLCREGWLGLSIYDRREARAGQRGAKAKGSTRVRHADDAAESRSVDFAGVAPAQTARGIARPGTRALSLLTQKPPQTKRPRCLFRPDLRG